MDETTSCLDVAILSLIKRFDSKQKTCVIFTSHHPDHAFAAAYKTLLLNCLLGYEFSVLGIDFISLNIEDKRRLLAR